MTEDNAYEDTTRVDGVERTDGGDRNNAEATQELPAKFKSVSALARAYEALQAEFTRRSQKLKELERKTENFELERQKEAKKAEKLAKNVSKIASDEASKDGNIKADGLKNLEPVTEEKLPLTDPSIGENLENGHTMDEMNSHLTDTDLDGEAEKESCEKELSQTQLSIFEDEENGDLGEARKGENSSPSAAKGGDAAAASLSLYEQVQNDESVRLKIIGEYLSSLGKTSVPLMTSGAGTLATPPKKAKSISQAGDMALLYFKHGHNA